MAQAGNRACRRKHKQWWEYKRIRKASEGDEYTTLIFCPICAGTAGRVTAKLAKEKSDA